MSEYPSYLIHYGIEGQKWGVRRFQNENGTWTEEGLRRRYSLNESQANKLAKTYDKNPKKFSKAVGKLAAVKAYKKDNPYEKEYSAKTRKKWMADQETTNEAYTVGQMKKEELHKNNSDFFIGKAKKIYSEEEITKEYEKAINNYLKSDVVNKRYNDIDKDLNSSYSSYVSSGKKFTDSILGKYGNIKLSDGATLSEKFAEELLKNKRGKAYNSPSKLNPRPDRQSVKQKEAFEDFKRKDPDYLAINTVQDDYYRKKVTNNGLSRAGNMANIYARTNRNIPLQNKINRDRYRYR